MISFAFVFLRAVFLAFLKVSEERSLGFYGIFGLIKIEPFAVFNHTSYSKVLL